MNTRPITESAKKRLIEAVKKQLSDDSGQPYDVTVHGFLSLVGMHEVHILESLQDYGIDPYAD